MEIRLREWKNEDKEALITLCNSVNRQYLTNRMPYPYTTEAAEGWLAYMQRHDGVDCLFRAITVDGKIAGHISIEGQGDVYQTDGVIGYYLNGDYQSKGIMTQAVAEICPLAFEKLDIVRISSRVIAENVASRRVLEKNGFLLEGVMKRGAVKEGRIYDVCLYAFLK